MAFNVISRIQVRSGFGEDLPQLAKGELGWSVDTQQLWIGNGTYIDGAPNLGNTLILTTPSSNLTNIDDGDSDIVIGTSALDNITYIFKGLAAGYTAITGPSGGDIMLPLQSILDEGYISVKKFGAKGDGFTNDTDAINRAFYQIYCRGTNVKYEEYCTFQPECI